MGLGSLGSLPSGGNFCHPLWSFNVSIVLVVYAIPYIAPISRNYDFLANLVQTAQNPPKLRGRKLVGKGRKPVGIGRKSAVYFLDAFFGTCVNQMVLCFLHAYCLDANKMEPKPERLESRAWSCGTLEAGLELAGKLNLTMSAFGDDDIKAMEEELAKLQVG